MKKTISIILLCALIIGAFFLGKYLNFDRNGYSGATETANASEKTISRAEDSTSEFTEQKLKLSFTVDEDAYSEIPLGLGNYKEITYAGVKDVVIDIGGTATLLEEALQSGAITVDEIVAYARADAANGLCTEESESKNGLTRFIYYYSDFRIYTAYDLYETPDGNQYFIADFAVCPDYADGNINLGFSPIIDEESGEAIDYEDWGLGMSLVQADTSNFTVKFTQSGGQQFGQLNVCVFSLNKADPDILWELVPALDDQAFIFDETWEPDPDYNITMGGETELSFDLEAIYGELEPGIYRLDLQVIDCYDPEDVPSLMRNYYDAQWYGVEFTVE